MELISFFFILSLQICFSLTTGLINGPGICVYNANTQGCCKNYKEVDGSCEWETGLYDGPGVCKDFSGNLRCCTNYQQKENHCKPCEIGTFGVNCTGGPCKNGFYGFGCLGICRCTNDQYCDRKTGCSNTTYNPNNNGTESLNRDEQEYVISTVSAVAIAVFLGIGSILVIIVFLYNERLKFLRQYLTKLGTNREENDNNTRHESEEDQEDYSQMTRASNNYNILSFNRFNVVSRVNVTEEEEIYDQGGAVIPSQTEYSQDSYVSLALRQNHVTHSSNGIKEVICDVEEEVVSDKTYAPRDSYITLALNPRTSPKTAGNTKGNTGKSKQKTRAGRSDKNDQDIYANTLPRFPLNYYVLENDKIDSKGKKRNMNDTL